MKKIIIVENESEASVVEGAVTVWRNWEQEGALNYVGETTLKHYHELKEESYHHDFKGIFFAFSDEQFMRGLDKLGIPRDDFKGKIFKMPGGGFGTKQGIHDFYQYHHDLDERIKNECDPQEVYLYEYNNHESMINWEGDDDAMRIIISTWGADIAKQIHRWSVYTSVDDLANPKK